MLSPVSTKEEAKSLLTLPDAELFASANALREHVFGNTIDCCAIINAKSGNCSMDCAFCSQAKSSKTAIQKHPLLPIATLKERILELSKLPVAHIGIVTSGGILSQADVDQLCTLFTILPKELVPRVCASLGRLPSDALGKLRDAGLTRFHHNLECSQAFYPRVCTTQDWKDRLNTVVTAKTLGLTNCTGGLFGMGESWDDRIDLAFTLKEHQIMHVPMNFLHPHPQTPLGQRSPLSAQEALRCIALFRHILPQATLRVCGGRPITFGARHDAIFSCGANALMIGDYLTTQGEQIAADKDMLARCHLAPSMP